MNPLQKLLEGWVEVGRQADVLLGRAEMTPEEREGILSIRRGAAKVIASFDEGPFPNGKGSHLDAEH